MTQQQVIAKGDVLQKTSSASFISATVLLVTGSLLLPHSAGLTTDLKEMLGPLGQHERLTEIASLLIMLGFLAMMVGATGVYQSITAAGAPWARIGFYLLLAGTTLQIVSLSLDVATASAVAKWLAAPAEAKEAAWSVVILLNAIGRGVVPMTWIVYWMGLAFLGIGMIGSALYPRLLGWGGVILSIPVIATGIFHTFNARTTTITLVFVVLALLTNLWALAVGIRVARKAW